MKKFFTVLFFLTWSSFSFSDVYITDQLDLPIRSDKSFGENIIRLLPSGTKLSLIKNTEDGWSQVKFGNTTGWIKSFYLSSEPSARNKLKTLLRTDQANKLLIENLLSKNEILNTEVNTLKTQIEFLEIRKQALLDLGSNVEIVEELVSESDALAQAALKEIEKIEKQKAEAEALRKAEEVKTKIAELKRKAEEAKTKEAELLAKEAEEKRKLEEERLKLALKEQEKTQLLIEEERIKLDELEAERAKQLLAFESEQYNRLITQEIQDEQDLEREARIQDQRAILQSAWISNIAAKIRSMWRYQGAIAGWTAEVYVLQDKDGKVLSVDVRNANVGSSSKAKAFTDSIKRAVFNASPLPTAPDEAVFNNEILMTFTSN